MRCVCSVPRWIVCLLLALVCDFSAQAQQKTANSIAAATATAQGAFAARDYRKAAELFQAIAAREQARGEASHTGALLMEAKCLVNLREYAQADSTLRSFLKLEPRSAEALYLLGFVQQRENQPAASLRTYTAAAAITPPLPNDLKLVALDYVLLNDYDDAIHWLQRSVGADPRNAEAWYSLGRAQMHQGHFADAATAFQRSLAVVPQDPKTLDNLGLSYEALNQPEEALKAYRAAVEASTALPHPRADESEQPLLDLGTLLNSRERFAEATPLLLHATAMAPASSRSFEELARAYAGAGQNGPARTAMERAVALDPKNPRLHFQLGRIYRGLGLTDRAQGEFKRSSDLYGTHSTPVEP